MQSDERLDERDLAILELLEKDSRTPFTTIGKKLGITDATVYLRVKKMVGKGIIKKFTIVVDEKKVKSKVYSFLLLNVTPGKLDQVAEALIAEESVAEVYAVYAPNDLLAKISADNLDKLRDCVQEIRQIPNVTSTTLITALKKWEKASAQPSQTDQDAGRNQHRVINTEPNNTAQTRPLPSV